MGFTLGTAFYIQKWTKNWGIGIGGEGEGVGGGGRGA